MQQQPSALTTSRCTEVRITNRERKKERKTERRKERQKERQNDKKK
jgi:hypothetical protein